MTITTPDGYIAAVAASTSRNRPLLKNWPANKAAGQIMTTWLMAGCPGAGSVPASGMAGAVCDDNTPGAIQLWTPTGTLYLNGGAAGVQSGTSRGGMALIVDRLWEQSGIVVTTTTAQTINSVALPARDEDMATDGDGVYMALDVSTVTGNAGAVTNMTASYTNSVGTAGRTARVASFPITATAGTSAIFALDDGDQGVRSIQSITLGTSLVSGVVNLKMFRILGVLGVDNWGVGGGPLGGLSMGLPKLGGPSTQSCIEVMIVPATAAIGTVFGQLNLVEG